MARATRERACQDTSEVATEDSVTAEETRSNEESQSLPPKPSLELALIPPADAELNSGKESDPENPIFEPPSPRLLELVIKEPPLGACFKTICGHVLVERVEHYSPVLAAGVTPGCVLVSIGDQMVLPEASDSAVEVLNKLAAIGGGCSGISGGSDSSSGSGSGDGSGSGKGGSDNSSDGSSQTPLVLEAAAPVASAEKDEGEEEEEEEERQQQEDDPEGYFVAVTADFPLFLSFRRHAESSLDIHSGRQGLRQHLRQRSRVVVAPNVTAGIASRTTAVAAAIAASDDTRVAKEGAAGDAADANGGVALAVGTGMHGETAATAAATAAALGRIGAAATAGTRELHSVSPGEANRAAADDCATAIITGADADAEAPAAANNSLAPPEEDEDEAAEWSPWDPLPQGDPGKEDQGAATALAASASTSTAPTLEDLETARLALEGNGGGAWRPDQRGWPLPSGESLEQASAAGGVSGVGAAELEQVTGALGPSVAPGLAAHMLRACGGDVAGALELYYAVEEEYLELLARAGGCGSRHLRRGESNGSIGITASASADAVCDGSGSKPRRSGGIEAGELITGQGNDSDFPMFEASAEAIATGTDEYEVSIESDKLGMTVENVLERTVVRAVSPGSAADKAGVETGSLLTSLGGQSSRSMSHFETIEQLRQAQRPLMLRLRRVEPERLQRRRAEMRALIHPQDPLLNPRAAAASDALASRGFPVVESEVRNNGPRGFLSSMAGAAAAGFSGGSGNGSHSAPSAANTGASSDAAAGSNAAAAAIATGGNTRALKSGVSVALLPTLGSVIGPELAYGQPLVPDDSSAAVAAATAATAAIVSWAEERLLSVLRLLCVGQALRGGGPHVVPNDGGAAAVVGDAGAVAANAQTSVSCAGHAAAVLATAAAADTSVGFSRSLSGDLQAAGEVEALSAAAIEADAAAAVRDDAAFRPTVPAAEEAAAAAEETAAVAPARDAVVDTVTEENAAAAAGENAVAAATAATAGGFGGRSDVASTAPPTPEEGRSTGTYIPVLSAMQVVLEWNQGVAGASRSVGRRIEDMSAVLDQLAAVVDWGDETVHAVEHDLRELLCLLLDVDRNFDLTSATFPGILGGAVAVLLRELVLHLDDEQLCTQMVPLVQRLAVSQSVTSRVACCSIVPLVYGGLPLPQQLQLRGVLSRFVHDITASVRKEAAEAIQAVADVADSSAVSWLLLLCERAACDAEFSVRRVAVGTCLHLANKLPAVLRTEERPSAHGMGKSVEMARAYYRESHQLQCKLLPVVTRLAEDSDWQVRLAVARHCDCLCAALGAQWTALMVGLLQNLLEDVDMEVRSEAVHCLPRLAHAMLQLAAEGSTTGRVGTDATAAAIAAANAAAAGPIRPAKIAGTVAATTAMEAGAAAATTAAGALGLPPVVPYWSSEDTPSVSRIVAPKPSRAAAAPAVAQLSNGTGSLAPALAVATAMREAEQADAAAAATLAEAEGPLARGAAAAAEEAAAARAATMVSVVVPVAASDGPSSEFPPAASAAAEGVEISPEEAASSDLAFDGSVAGGDAAASTIERRPDCAAAAALSSPNPAEDESGEMAEAATLPSGAVFLTTATVAPPQQQQQRHNGVSWGIGGGSSSITLAIIEPCLSTSGAVATSSLEAGTFVAGAEESTDVARSANTNSANMDAASVPVAALVEEREHMSGGPAAATAMPLSLKEPSLASSLNGLTPVQSLTGASAAAAIAAATAAATARGAVAGESGNPAVDRQCAPQLSRDAWLQAQARVLDALVPPATKLVADPAPEVRAALAAAVGDLLRLITGPWADAAAAAATAAAAAPLPGPSLIERLPSIGEGDVLDASLSPSPPPAAANSNNQRGAAAAAVNISSGTTAAAPLSPGVFSPSTSPVVVEVATAQWAVDQLLVPLVQQLLQDSDLMVASAMLQGLRPAAATAARGASAWVGAAASGGGGTMAAVAAMEGSGGGQGRPGSGTGSGAGSGSSVGAVVVSTAGSSDILYASPASRASSSTSEENEAAKVRVHMPPLLTAPQVGCILHAVEQLAASRQWRTRQAAVEALPALAGAATDKAFRRRVTALLARLLEDPVDAVRRAAAEHTCVAARADFDRCPGRGRCAGNDCPLGCGSWMRFVLLPQLAGLQAARSFRSRMLVLYTIQALVSVGLATSELLQNVLVPAVNRAAGDALANVRMSAARVVEELAAASLRTPRLWHPAVMESLLCTASALRGDPDRDVAYYAGRALMHFLAPAPQLPPAAAAVPVAGQVAGSSST